MKTVVEYQKDGDVYEIDYTDTPVPVIGDHIFIEDENGFVIYDGKVVKREFVIQTRPGHSKFSGPTNECQLFILIE